VENWANDQTLYYDIAIFAVTTGVFQIGTQGSICSVQSPKEHRNVSLESHKMISISQQASKSHGVEGMCGRQSPDNVI